MDIVHIISKIREQKICVNETFMDNRLGWEICDNDEERSEIVKGAYCLTNKTNSDWQFYDRPGVIPDDSDFILSVKYRVVDPGDLGNFGIVWGQDKNAKMLNRFVFNSNHNYCAAMTFQRDTQRDETQTMFRASKTTRPQIENKYHEYSLSIIKLGGFYYFFAGNTHSPVLIEKENSFIMKGTYAGFYTEPGMRVEVTSFISKKLVTETVNEGTFDLLLDRIHK